jgi:hypothetical protein
MPQTAEAIAAAIQHRTDGWASLALNALREDRTEDAAFYASHRPGERMRTRRSALQSSAARSSATA